MSDQEQRIREKAQQLGISGNSLEEIASNMGLSDFDPAKDLNILENKLSDRIASEQYGAPASNPEALPEETIPSSGEEGMEPQKFGQAEYNAAKNDYGVYDPDYYKKKQLEIKQRIDDAQKEKERDTKEVPDKNSEKKSNQGEEESNKPKEDNNSDNQGNEDKPGDNKKTDDQGKNDSEGNSKPQSGNQNNRGNNQNKKTVNKNALDRAKDRANLTKAKLDSARNKLAEAKAKAYNATHPGEALKDKTKAAAKKAVKKAETKAKNAIVNLIKKNPYILLIALGAALLFLLLIMIFAAFTGDKQDGGGGSSSADSSSTNGYSYNSTIGESDGIPFTSTTLSKEEFRERFRSYVESHPTSYDTISAGRQVFLNNIDLIYDTGVSYNINPEIIVVRATLEGFSPGRNNNYWGMGCTNTGGGLDCTKYDSFQEAVRIYAEKAKRFSSYKEMISQYAYLGDYWYKPGSSAQGGCYYLEMLKPYMSTDRYNEVNSYCTSDSYTCTKTETDGCFKTIEEDYDANVQLHIDLAIKQRKTIFGLEPIQSYNEIHYSGNYIINPDDKLYSGLKTLHGIPPTGSYSFEQLLHDNGQTIESYNAFLKSSIESAGVGTRNGVITAAMTLIGSLAEMGYKLNYRWGGKYGHIGVNPNWGSYSLNNYCSGIEDVGKRSKCSNNYNWGGFDCSGFVRWALVNGMQNESIPQQNTTISPESANQKVLELDPNRPVCRPGGVLVSEPHIVLVVGVDANKKKYIVAESTGNYITQDTGGLRLYYYSYNAKSSKGRYVCKNLEEIYGD